MRGINKRARMIMAWRMACLRVMDLFKAALKGLQQETKYKIPNNLNNSTTLEQIISSKSI
jgi:hypothetical protein